MAAAVVLCGACGGGPGQGLSADARAPADVAPTLDPPVDAAAPVDQLAGDASNGELGVPAEPIRAPDGEWTWIDVPQSRCANGTPTGFGARLKAGSKDVLIFLQGGGACWDAASCWGPVMTSFYVATGYGPIEFATDVQRAAVLPLRGDDPQNPFRGMNLIYVPYCTGDVHAGDKTVTYTYLGIDHVTFHVGRRNLGLVLDRVVATLPDAARVILGGDSAGGFGAALNLPAVQARFGAVKVSVLDDSGQPIQPAADRWQTWQQAWNLSLPPDCTGCSERVDALIDYYRQRYSDNVFALISYTRDSVISSFMGLSLDQFHDELYAAADRIDQSWPHARYFFLDGLLHVGLATATPALVSWLDQMARGDPAWTSVRP